MASKTSQASISSCSCVPIIASSKTRIWAASIPSTTSRSPWRTKGSDCCSATGSKARTNSRRAIRSHSMTFRSNSCRSSLGGRRIQASILRPRKKTFSGVCSNTAATVPPTTIRNAENCNKEPSSPPSMIVVVTMLPKPATRPIRERISNLVSLRRASRYRAAPIGEGIAQHEQGPTMGSTDSRFIEIENQPDLFHIELVLVIERHHHPFPFWQRRDRLGQRRRHAALIEGCFLVIRDLQPLFSGLGELVERK